MLHPTSLFLHHGTHRKLLLGASVIAMLAVATPCAHAQKDDNATLEDLFGAEEPAAPKPSVPENAPPAPIPSPKVTRPAEKAPAAPVPASDPSLEELFGEPAPAAGTGTPDEEEKKKAAPATPAAAPESVEKTPPPKPAEAPATMPDSSGDLDALFQELPEPAKPSAPELPEVEKPQEPVPPLTPPAAKKAPEEAPKTDEKPVSPESAEKPLLPSEILKESGEVVSPATPATPAPDSLPDIAKPLTDDAGKKAPEPKEDIKPKTAKPAVPAWQTGPEIALPETMPEDGDEEMLRSSEGPAAGTPLPPPTTLPMPATESALPPPGTTPPAMPAAPAAPASVAPAFAGTMMVPFPPFQTRLTPDLQQYLDRLVSGLQGSRNIEIVGYANWTANGSLDASKRLSATRASAIKAYLIGKGIPATSVMSRGAGLDFRGGVPRDRVEIIVR